MICPNDSAEMHQVRITSHYGQPIVLEQCGKCGGIWFDESELFVAKQGEAEKIELLDAEGLRNTAKLENATLCCPRDQATLFRFADKHFPNDIVLERCPLCRGIWLNRGEFTNYQRFRQELRQPKERSSEDGKLEEKINQLVTSYQAGESTAVLGKLGRFLSTPVDDGEALPPDTDQGPPVAANAANLVMSLLMTILRLFILR
jgi:Zn-finger nucleic acid-binding protein